MLEWRAYCEYYAKKQCLALFIPHKGKLMAAVIFFGTKNDQ
jgi:hypothetical protein